MPTIEETRERQERMKALDTAVGQIEKQFGKGSIMRLGQNNIIAPVESISTGAIKYSLEPVGSLRMLSTT